MSIALKEALRSAFAEEIVEALLGLDGERPGLAYDVGTLLLERGPCKKFPGPDPDDISPKHPNVGEVLVFGYDPSRREDAIRGYRELWGHPVPTYDENDPKWLKATRAERRAAKRAVEDFQKRGDGAKSFIETLDRAMAPRSSWDGMIRPSCQSGAPQTRAEAEAEVARWATFGVKAKVQGYEEPAKSHVRRLHPFVGPARG